MDIVYYCQKCSKVYAQPGDCTCCDGKTESLVALKDALQSHAERLTLKLGDFVVITFPDFIPYEAHERMKKVWEDVIIPGTKLIILEKGARVTSILARE